MATKRVALGERPDGRLYSRITRRCVALLKHIRGGRRFDLIEVAREAQAEGYPEFLIRRGPRMSQMSAERIRDYLSYIVELQMIQTSEGQYALNVTKPSTDEHWAQTLSDNAREHLSKMLEVPVAQLPRHLEQMRQKLHKNLRVPTMAAIVAETGIEGTRREETFRWSLYLYTDGDATPIEIRRYPHLVPKG